MRTHLIWICLVFLTACDGWMVSTEFDGTAIVTSGATGSRGGDASTAASGAQGGAALYQVNCSACHGDTGEGAAAFPNSIQGYEPIAGPVSDGLPGMPAFALPDSDVSEIQDFLLSLDVPTETLDGAGLYERFCARCHGADASAGPEWAFSIQAYEPIEEIVINGRGDMPAIPVTVEQNAQIQQWLLTLAAPAADLDGAGLYDRYCSSCHGADGSGAPNWPNSIQAYEPIEDIVMNGRGDMDPIPLDASQIADVQEFLLTLAPSLSSLTGPEVYDRLCVGCHGDRGAGTDTKGMQLRYDDDAFSEYWTRTGRGTNAFDSEMPAYPENMISSQQLDEMFTWINNAPRATDGEGLFNTYCGNCHGRDGQGGPAGERIAGDNSYGSIIRDGKGGSNYDSRGGYMTGWSTQQLSDAEVGLLAAYSGTL